MTALAPLIAYDVARAYAAVGLAVTAGFLWRGLDRVAPSAVGAYAFRPLLVPGLVLLWPLVLWRWHALTRHPGAAPHGRHYRRIQRAAAVLLALLPFVLVAAVALQQPAPPPPVRLDVPR